MKSTLPRVALTCLALGVCSTGFTQPLPIEFYRPMKNSVSIGVRMIGGNAKVGFSNIGNIPLPSSRFVDDDGNKFYHNGQVLADALRSSDTGGSGVEGSPGTEPEVGKSKTWYTRTALGPGRYILTEHVWYNDADNTKDYTSTRIFREYVDARSGFTRNWGYSSPSQIRDSDGTALIDMSRYSVTPSGATAQAESEKSTGVELQFSRIIKRYTRFEWGFNFSAASAAINAKTRNVVRANLHADVDTYAFADTDSYGNPITSADFPLWWYESTGSHQNIPTVIDYTSNPPRDDVISSYIKEGYRHLSYVAGSSYQYDTPVDVFGYWQIKGAYYLLKAGPTVRIPLFRAKWAVSISAGLAGAYVGTKFIADEYVIKTDVRAPLRALRESTEKRFLPGYYADVNVEHWLTMRTGVYVGYGYEKMDSYRQRLDTLRANVDLGSSSGFRFGIITRF